MFHPLLQNHPKQFYKKSKKVLMKHTVEIIDKENVHCFTVFRTSIHSNIPDSWRLYPNPCPATGLHSPPYETAQDLSLFDLQ